MQFHSRSQSAALTLVSENLFTLLSGWVGWNFCYKNGLLLFHFPFLKLSVILSAFCFLLKLPECKPREAPWNTFLTFILDFHLLLIGFFPQKKKLCSRQYQNNGVSLSHTIYNYIIFFQFLPDFSHWSSIFFLTSLKPVRAWLMDIFLCVRKSVMFHELPVYGG